MLNKRLNCGFYLSSIIRLAFTYLMKDVYSGKEFNETIVTNAKPLFNYNFVKLTIETDDIMNKSESSGYKTGLNIYTNINKSILSKNSKHTGTGTYFYHISDLCSFINYRDHNTNRILIRKHIRRVTIPDNATVRIELNHYITDKIILDEPTNIFEDYDLCLKLMQHNGLLLRYVKNQKREICLTAIKQNGYAIDYVKDKTYELYLEAVKQDGIVIQLIPQHHLTKELCLCAIKQNSDAIRFINTNINTAETASNTLNDIYLSEPNSIALSLYHYIALEAVKKDSCTLQHIMNQTDEICLEAVKKNGFVLRFVNNKTDEICMTAIKRIGIALQFVKDQTYEMCIEAIKQDSDAMQYVINKSLEFYLEALEHNTYVIKHIKNPTRDMCLKALNRAGKFLRYIKNQTEEICITAVKNDGMSLQFVHNQTPAICLEAVKQNGMALRLVKNQTEDICSTAIKQNSEARFYKNINP